VRAPSSLLANTASLAAARGFYGLVTFVATALVAHELGPGSAGVFGLVLVIGFFTGVLADAGVSLLLVPALARSTPRSWSGLWSQLGRFQLITAIPAAALFALLVSVAYDGETADLLLASIPWWLMLRATLSLRSFLTVGERLRYDAVAAAIEAIVTISALLAAVLLAGSITYAILAMGLGAAIGTALRIGFVRKMLGSGHGASAEPVDRGKMGVRDSVASTWSLLRRAVHFNTFNVLSVVYSRVDVVLLSAFVTPALLGVYQGPVRLVTAALLLPEALGLMMQGRSARDPHDEGNRATQQRLLNAGLIVSAVALAAMAVFGGPLLELLFGAPFAAGKAALILLFAVVPVRLASYFNGNELVAHDLQKLRTRCMGATAAFAVLAGIPGILAFGIEGAAAVTLASEALLGALYMVAVRGRIGPAAVVVPFRAPQPRSERALAPQ